MPAAPTFQPFTQAHAIALAWCGALLLAALIAGTLTKGKPAQKVVDRAIGGFAIVFNALSILFFATPPRLSWAMSLPLHMCDVALLATPFALLYPDKHRWARSLLYFWAIGLSSQAFITPTLQEGFPTLRYLQFWLQHIIIVGVAIYDVVCRSYRPRFADFRLIINFTFVWYFTNFIVNILIRKYDGGDANYGFNADTQPLNPTMIDRLGPWPLRAAILAILAITVMWLFWLPWGIAERLKRSRES